MAQDPVRIFVGERGVAQAVAAALEGAGFLVVRGEAPARPAAGDWSLVPAREGVTSSLRHVLGNHLTVILGYAEILLRRDDLPDPVRGRIGAIREGARACGALLKRPESEA